MASQYDLPYTGPQVETLLAKISELESEMPSKTSDLTNDSGFITSSDVPTKTSDLNNDSGFITNAPVAAEAARAQAAEALLATISSLQAEITRATGVEGTLQDLIDGIAAKIPSAATDQNQLADKAFVNSSIATATATFRGTYDSLPELQAVSADENDYGYVRTTDAAGNTIFKRYKYESGSWVFEYDLNNSSFTASQWAAINSAITAELVEKLRALPTNAALTELLNGKQGVIPDLDTIRANAAAGGTAYQKPSGGIPKSDMADGVIPDIADNLTTNDATKVLSAKQGKVLSEQVTQLDQELEELDRLVSSGSRVISYVDNEYVNNTNGLFVKYNGWSRTNYLDVNGLSTLDFNNPGASSIYNAFYDEGRGFIGSFSTPSNYSGSVPVPENASWAVFSNASSDLRQLTISNLPVRMGLGELSENVIAINEFTNADFPLYDGWMSNNNGSYAYAADRAFSVIPVREGVFYEITAKDTPCQLCFLKSFDGIPTTSFDTAASRMILATVGAKTSGVVPYGSNYIYVIRKYNGTETALPEILINGIDVASVVTSQVSELARENVSFQNDTREALIRYSGWMSANDGTYTNVTSNCFYVIPIKEGVPYEIEATATPCHLAFLNSFDGVPSSAFDINGTRLLLSSVGAKASGVVPTGAKYLYILARYSNTDISLPKIRVGEIDVLDDIYSQLYSLAEWTSWSKKVGLSREHTQELLASEANAYYINTNYTPAVLVASSGDFRLSNPIYLRSGDKVKVISPAMGFSAGKAVLAKTNVSVFSPTKMSIQAIDITPTGSGYDTTYDYTVTEAGYYLVGWAVQYSASHAYIIFAETDNIAKNTEDIGINAEKISKLEEMSIGPIVNVFGDILPKNFRDKFFGSVEDVEVVCVGDSLTGLVGYSGILDNPEHQAPGMLYKHWTYQLWDRLCLNKPVCDRLDSQRDGADVFTKVGTWSEYVNNTSGNYGDYSITADTYKSNSADASVSFVLNLDDYEKCNIVFSANPDGALAEIAIAEGNGKLLASLDKTTWVEANGFQVNEGTEDLRERHRRVWMKRASGATGAVNITFKRSSTDTGSSHYLYCWGTERFNGASLFLTNLGRGGRNMTILGANRMDIFDRKPDLCIFELPLANETVVGANTLTSLKQVYSDNLTYLRTLSNDFQDTEFLFVLPTGRTQYFDGNQAVEYVSSGTATMKNHLMAKAIFGYVAELTKNYRDNVGMVNLADQVYNEGLVRGYTLQGWIAPSSIDIPTITYDGVHLRNLGSTFWAKYLAGIFQ